jgi:ubiquitin-conjugating enzyme E2 W
MYALYILTALALSSSSVRATFPTLRPQAQVLARGDVSISVQSTEQHLLNRIDKPSISLRNGCVLNRALGRLAFIHRNPANTNEIKTPAASHFNPSISTTNNQMMQSALTIRGGASSSPNKVQSIIQSILDSSVLPEPIKQIILTLCKLIEDLTGFNILPEVKTRKSKAGKRKAKDVLVEEVSTKRRGGKSRQSKSRKSEVEDDVNVSSSTKTKSEAEDGDSEAEDATRNKSKEEEATTKSTTKTPTPSKPKTDAASKKFLSNNLKSSNPNYRIQRELKEFISSPPPGLSVKISGKNVRLWIITLTMPENTIYAGEVYKLRVQFPAQYPTVPPSVYFLPPTPRHEHVYTNGDICLSLLGKDWRPIMTAQSLAQAIMSILCGAQRKSLPMDNSRHAGNKPGLRQDDWVYHDDNC